MSQFLPWKIVHVALRQPLPDLTAEAGSGGLFLVFWCDHIPVGQLLVPASLLPISAIQLAATVPPIIARAVGNRLLREHSQALPVPFSRVDAPKPAPDLAHLLKFARPLESCSRMSASRDSAANFSAAGFVSVIICTRNRPEALGRCFAAMRKLSPQPNEILVVDNDPSSGLTRAVTAAFPEVRYVPEPRPGLSIARNTGVRNCVGEIIAFTDDDVVVHPGWIATMCKVFQDSNIVAATGLILPAKLETQAQFAFQGDSVGWNLGYEVLDFNSRFFQSNLRFGVPTWRMGAGANMAFRREAFERVGLFDERLGAGAAGCSEDTELWYRLLAEGLQCRYDPAAVVFHAHRPSWKELCDQTYSYMRGHVAALLFQYQRYGHRGNINRALIVLPRYFMRLAVPSLRQLAERFLVGSSKRALPPPLGSQVRGMLAGYAYYLRHRHNPMEAGTLRSPGPKLSARSCSGSA
jgi:GT2 family glycosyltransferase